MPNVDRQHSRGRWPDPFFAIGVLAIGLNLMIETGWRPLAVVLVTVWTAGLYIARFAYRRQHTLIRSLFALVGYAALFALLAVFRPPFEHLTSFILYIPALCSYAMPEVSEVVVVGSTLTGLCLSYLPQVGPSAIINNVFGVMTTTILWMMIFRLLLSVERERDRYYKLSITDSLTGLLTLGKALELGQAAIARGESVSLVIIDLDGFKEINDTYGHLAGNRMLTDFSRRLSSAVERISPSGVVGRLGGDEFVVIMPGGGSADLREALTVSLARETYRPAPQVMPRPLPFSLGGAIATGGSTASIEELMHQADLNMYANKRQSAEERMSRAEVAASGPFES